MGHTKTQAHSASIKRENKHARTNNNNNNMASITERFEGLKQMINEGKIIEAFKEYYAYNVAMIENNDDPCEGFEANLAREEQFVAMVKDWHWTKWTAWAVNEEDRVSIAEYSFEFTTQDDAVVKYAQTTVQRWDADGKIYSEHFRH